MRIGKRLSIGYWTIFAFLLVLAILLELTLANLVKYRKEADAAHGNMEIVRDLDRALCRQAKELMDMIVTGSNKELEEFAGYTETVASCFTSWEIRIRERKSENEFYLLGRIRDLYQSITKAADKQINAADTQELAELSEELEDKFEDKLMPLIQQAIDIQKENIHKAETSANQAYTMAISIVSGIILCSLVTVAVLSITITRSITRPLNKLKTTVEQVKSGNLDIEAAIDSRDEIESLAAAFNNMIRDLKMSMVTIDSLNLEIARREKLEIQLQNTNSELNDFVHIASHHMREPLRKIRSFGCILSNAISSKLTAEEQENLDFVIEGSQKMNEVINSLLKYYQLENRQFKPRPVSLTEIIDDLLQNELDNINQTVDINVQVPPELPAISADENSLRETMYHLISNAFKYRQKDIPLHISITAELMDDEHIKILVQDNGIGLKEMYHKDIFKMFKKVTAEDNASGPGIGLALCKKIVSKHGGDIGVTSSSGEGAAFWFTMPVAHEPAAALNAMGIS